MVDITITIPDDKVAELATYFLYNHPIPLDDEGEPLYTLLVWFKMWLYKQIVNAYKRYGLYKYIELPDLLRNLANYLEEPPLVHLKYVHPNELPKTKKVSKREFNKLCKYYFKIYPNKTKKPNWPKSGKINKQLTDDFKKLKEYLGC